MSGISRDDWLAAYDAANVPPQSDPDFLTIGELAELFQCDRMSAARRVKRMLAAGKVEAGQKWVRQGQGSSWRRVPAYRLVK